MMIEFFDTNIHTIMIPNVFCNSYPITYLLLKGHLLETSVSLSWAHHSLKA